MKQRGTSTASRTILAVCLALLHGRGSATPISADKVTDPAGRPESPPLSAELAAKAFDDLWHEMDFHYSYFSLKTNVGWTALKDEFRPKAIQATNAAQFAAVLEQLLAPLQDLHVWIETADGRIPTYISSYQYNGNRGITFRALEETIQCGEFAIIGKTKEDGFGCFVMKKQSRADEKSVTEAVAVMHRLRATPGFIVDLRQAKGGSEPLAQQIASFFCGRDTVYAKQKYRDGPGHSDFTPEMERVLTASEDPYTNPVVCLIGPGAVSSGEGFVKMMKGLPNVITIGMPTRGASGNPKPFTLEGTGLTVVFSRWVDLLPDGQTFEGRGIPPDVKVDVPTSAYAERDPTLEKALEVLRHKTQHN